MSKQKSFEEALQELEKIVGRLESGELPLEESIALFEQGMALSVDCRKTLETAKQKVVNITDAEKGSGADD